MKKNNGITIIALVVTIILIILLAGISIGTGNNVIKRSELENLKTNMLLIKVKGKEYVENANFNLGTAFRKLTDENEKNTRIEKAKSELKGTDITEEISSYEMINIEESTEYIYYYKLDMQNLIDIGLTNVQSDEENGWYIIEYDIINAQVEVYNTKGFENEKGKYYALKDIQDIEI